MVWTKLSKFPLLLVLLVPLGDILLPGNPLAYYVEASDEISDVSLPGWSWDRILTSGETIVANGNVFPSPKNESADDCLILVSRNQIMWHCPPEEEVASRNGDINQAFYNRTTIFRTVGGRIRGAFSAPGTDRRRLWLLESPHDRDLLMELDTVSGEIVQTLEIEGTMDGHDAVRVEDRIFVVDSSNGHIVEVELPVSAAPYIESSIAAGAKEIQKPGFVTIIKRHTGFKKANHVNNVAIHPQLLISSLHGGKTRDTRLSALSRSMNEGEGRELDPKNDGFIPVSNVGIWCHNIAFWEDVKSSQIKLISLDSMAGTLVSVALSGPSQGQREVLWAPDLNHPTLVPPEGVTKAYDNGARVFTKGLAVQGGVAYFAASYARAPPLRKNIPESLLVAVDLTNRKELWARTIRSNGMISQILTKSYLGWRVQLPAAFSSIEMTYHNGGGTLVEHCEDMIDNGSKYCSSYEKDDGLCETNSPTAWDAREVCCACGGGDWYQMPHITGRLDEEILKLDEEVTATATFVNNHQCLNENKEVNKLPTDTMAKDRALTIENIDRNLDFIVKYICYLDVAPIQERLSRLGEESFVIHKRQIKNSTTSISPDTTEVNIPLMSLIHSARNEDDHLQIYHFPELEMWLPLIQELVLQPMGLKLNHITGLMFAKMPENSLIEDSFFRNHSVDDSWAHQSHRVYIPITTHPDVFFLAKIGGKVAGTEREQILRIKSNPGEVHEFNNAIAHVAYNFGMSHINLVLEWVEQDLFEDKDPIKLPPE